MITNLREAIHTFIGIPKCDDCGEVMEDKYTESVDGRNISATYLCRKCDMLFFPLRNFALVVKRNNYYTKLDK